MLLPNWVRGKVLHANVSACWCFISLLHQNFTRILKFICALTRFRTSTFLDSRRRRYLRFHVCIKRSFSFCWARYESIDPIFEWRGGPRSRKRGQVTHCREEVSFDHVVISDRFYTLLFRWKNLSLVRELRFLSVAMLELKETLVHDNFPLQWSPSSLANLVMDAKVRCFNSWKCYRYSDGPS